jgi:hypothetical protein
LVLLATDDDLNVMASLQPVFYRAVLMRMLILIEKPGNVALGPVRRDPADGGVGGETLMNERM